MKANKIPTGKTKEEIKQREKIINDFYRDWVEKHPQKRVYNINLKDFINIRFISITETKRHAAKSYFSTLAVLQLEAILSTAKQKGKPLEPKKGVKNQKEFASMLQMECKFEGIGTVKLMVGVKRNTEEKIQYCVTVIQS